MLHKNTNRFHSPNILLLFHMKFPRMRLPTDMIMKLETFHPSGGSPDLVAPPWSARGAGRANRFGCIRLLPAFYLIIIQASSCLH